MALQGPVIKNCTLSTFLCLKFLRVWRKDQTMPLHDELHPHKTYLHSIVISTLPSDAYELDRFSDYSVNLIQGYMLKK